LDLLEGGKREKDSPAPPKGGAGLVKEEEKKKLIQKTKKKESAGQSDGKNKLKNKEDRDISGEEKVEEEKECNLLEVQRGVKKNHRWR